MTHDSQATTSRSRRCWYLAGASCLAAVLAFATAFPLMMFGACAGWILACVGLCLATAGVWRSIRESGAGKTHGRARCGWPAAALCTLLLVAQTIVCLRMLAVIRHMTEGAVSQGNLRGIDLAIHEYVKRNRAYPGRFEDLVTADGIVGPKQFVSPFDDTPPRGPFLDQLEYSSYVYAPVPGDRCDDAPIVLAYERKPWYLKGTWMFAGQGRWVLFGDGQTRLLDDAAFTVALTNDHARRRELGWPTDVVYTPSTRATSQQAATRPAAP